MLTNLKGTYQFFILLVLCAIFICIKIPTLNIPLYWDEAWVYAPAIKKMAETGISLLPGGLSDSYSRGHPLLFFFTGAIWVKLFGSNLISLHTFSLTLSLCLVFTIFYVIKKIFNPTLALVVAAVTLAQPIFIAQSALVLPEIFLALWGILTIYHFVINNKFYYCVFGTLLVMSKESGVVIIAAIMIYNGISFLIQKFTIDALKSFIKVSLFTFIPIIPFLIFLQIQHYQKGYYFLPFHTAFINFDWKTLQGKLMQCYDTLFIGQGRIFITLSFLLLFGLLYKQIPLIVRWVIIISPATSIILFINYPSLPECFILPVMGICVGIYYYFVHIKYKVLPEKAEKLLAVIFITGIAFILFSSINFLMNRYLFVLIPLMVIYFSYYIVTHLQFRRFLPHIWSAFILSSLIFNAIFGCNYTNDDSPKYLQAVRLSQMIAKYMEEHKLQQSKIYSMRFITQIVLRSKNSGYLSGNTIFVHASNTLNKNTEYVIYTNFDFDPLLQKGNNTLSHFQIVKTFDYGIAHAKLFKRNS